MISSTFSTVVSQLFAARIGRDPWVDWMTVAAIPARDLALSADPSWSAVAVGIAFHQWADFSWALVFFGILGRWTARLPPLAILLLALPWAVLTSASEWFVLVPLLPFRQPLFTLQQPYWIGLLVHASSSLMYPLFVWLRRRTADPSELRFVRIWGAGALIVVVLLSASAMLGSLGRELLWMGQDRETDESYIRHMTAHHAQGIELARLGAERTQDDHLRSLSRLMVASQTGENRIFENFWQSWFGTSIPDCTADEREAMPGYLTPAQLQQITTAPSGGFDALFVRLMSLHHAGAVKMADEEWRGRGDPRLRIMAHAIRHEQQGEIALMHGLEGTAAVAAAFRNMFADNIN